jgi:drug/metabolite transporter (DMT)-like permease
LILALLAALRGPSRLLVTRRQAIVLAIAGVSLAVHFATWIASLQYTTVAISTLLVATTPIFTALYDAIALKRPLTRLAQGAFVAGGIGLWLIVGFNRTPPPIPGHTLLGAALALAGAIAIAVYFLLVRGVRESLDTRTIVTHTYTWAALALVVASAGAHQAPPQLDNVTAWSGILGMALISQLLGHTAMNASLRWFTPSAVSFSTLLEPAIAAVLALFIFGESIAPAAIAGAAILLASLGVVLREEPLAETNS